MGERERRGPGGKDLVDLAIALLPVAVVLAIQYRDELARLQMRWENWLVRQRLHEADAMLQVQREISWMEHGVGGEPDADGL